MQSEKETGQYARKMNEKEIRQYAQKMNEKEIGQYERKMNEEEIGQYARKMNEEEIRREKKDGFDEPSEKNTFERIYDVVRQIPYGRVATYGQIAALAGNKRLSRVVGYALHVNPDPEQIPCYRVVNRLGEVSQAFAFGGGNRQIELLKAEGVRFTDGRVDMKTYQWERRAF